MKKIRITLIYEYEPLESDYDSDRPLSMAAMMKLDKEDFENGGFDLFDMPVKEIKWEVVDDNNEN